MHARVSQRNGRVSLLRHRGLDSALGDAAVTAHGGALFKTIGETVQAAFHTVPDAIAAGVDAQAALRDEDWGELGPMQVQTAIHAGEAIPRDGDYLAPVLNRLSRVLSTGYGGQILLTEAARALATSLPAEHALRDIGQHRLRDLLEAEHVFQLTGPRLVRDPPPTIRPWPGAPRRRARVTNHKSNDSMRLLSSIIVEMRRQ